MFKKTTGKGPSIPMGIGLGVLLSLAVTVTGAAVMAYVLSAEKMAVSNVGWGTIVIAAIASFAGGLLAAGLAKVKRLLVCLSVGAGYILILLGCTALFYGGQFQGVVATVIAVVIASLCAGLIGLNRKKVPVRKIKIPAYR